MCFGAGCASVSSTGSIAESALEAVGLKKPQAPEVPDALKAPRNIQINLHASKTMNIGENGQSLSLVTRVYKLKQSAAFQQASYDTFLSSAKEKEVLGTDLIEVKELTLVPGQRYQFDEKVSKEAYFIGVVALFRSPAQQRWRVTFSSAEIEKTGITIGMHACALSVGTGTTVKAGADDNSSLSAVRCQ
jgi:type VI secretion system protein VasD